METTIRPLSPELLDDYLYFFDNIAFSDHPEWAWCYCTYYHLGQQDEQRIEEEFSRCRSRDTLRNIAIDLIKSGGLRGYLAYADGQVVGWCNASDKRGYKKLCENHDIWDDDAKSLPIKAVTCFTIAPAARRQGVAAALLDRVLQDAAAEGYQVVEAYPADGELDCYGHYHGHPVMFEKCGFVPYRQLDGYSVYRKTL